MALWRLYHAVSAQYVDQTVKAGLSKEKLSLMPCLRILSNAFFLNALHSNAKQLRIVLSHGIRPDFLDIHLLQDLSYCALAA